MSSVSIAHLKSKRAPKAVHVTPTIAGMKRTRCIYAGNLLDESDGFKRANPKIINFERSPNERNWIGGSETNHASLVPYDLQKIVNDAVEGRAETVRIVNCRLNLAGYHLKTWLQVLLGAGYAREFYLHKPSDAYIGYCPLPELKHLRAVVESVVETAGQLKKLTISCEASGDDVADEFLFLIQAGKLEYLETNHNDETDNGDNGEFALARAALASDTLKEIVFTNQKMSRHFQPAPGTRVKITYAKAVNPVTGE